MKNYLDNSNIQIKDRFFLIVRANVVNFQVWSASKFVSLANWDDCWNHKLAFCFKHLLGGGGGFYAYQNTFIFRGNSFIDTLRNPSIQPCFTEDNNQSLNTQSSSRKCLIFHQNPDWYLQSFFTERLQVNYFFTIFWIVCWWS